MANNIYNVVDFDGHLPVIDKWHHECHLGAVYGFHYENFALASSSSIFIHIRTGSKDVHTDVEFSALGGILQAIWYEGATVATVGTVISCNNRNRYYGSTTALTSMYVGTTVTTTGTVTFGARALLGSSSAIAKAGSNITGQAERILLPSTDYLIKLTATGIVQLSVDGLFYEETITGS